MSHKAEQRLGGIYAITAFSFWGLVPIYYKLIGAVSPTEILAHRALWTTFFIALMLPFTKLAPSLKVHLADRKKVGLLTLSAFLIGTNWLIFTWAVANDRIIETSMGYFINPLVNVLLGVVVLGERLRRLQFASVAIAALGVVYLVVSHGALPWIAIILPLTFGLYGLLRKTVEIEPLNGLLIETSVLSPFALGYVVYLAYSGEARFLEGGVEIAGMLVLAGPVTMFPLVFFAAAARRITLTALGFFQYIGPSLTFLLGVFVYHEPFDRAQLITFSLIWLSLALYSIDGIRRMRSIE